MTIPTWLNDTTIWLKALVAAFVGGAATAGSQALSIATAKGIGIHVDVPSWKALGIMMLVAGVASALAYLKTSPVPSTFTQTTQTTQVTQTTEKKEE